MQLKKNASKKHKNFSTKLLKLTKKYNKHWNRRRIKMKKAKLSANKIIFLLAFILIIEMIVWILIFNIIYEFNIITINQ